MTKAYSRAVTALFCLFLGGLLVWHVLLPDRDRSEVENRTLAQLPAFSWQALKDGSYTAEVEEYFADQFPRPKVDLTTGQGLDTSTRHERPNATIEPCHLRMIYTLVL